MVMFLLDELLYPRRCPVCMDVVPWGEWICDECKDKMQPVRGARCLRCGRGIADEQQEYCTGCSSKRHSFERGVSGFDYRKPQVRDMIMQVKYHNARQLLDYPCAAMAEEYSDTVRQWRCDCLIPVPVHKKRMKKRGFNQAEEIAMRLSYVWGLPVNTKGLRRVKATRPQKELDRESRLANLLQAFEADARQLKGAKQIILIDDIYTTGATIEACSRALTAAGIEKIYAAVLAAAGGK